MWYVWNAEKRRNTTTTTTMQRTFSCQNCLCLTQLLLVLFASIFHIFFFFYVSFEAYKKYLQFIERITARHFEQGKFLFITSLNRSIYGNVFSRSHLSLPSLPSFCFHISTTIASSLRYANHYIKEMISKLMITDRKIFIIIFCRVIFVRCFNSHMYLVSIEMPHAFGHELHSLQNDYVEFWKKVLTGAHTYLMQEW